LKTGRGADFLPDTTHFDLKCHEIRLFWGVIGVKRLVRRMENLIKSLNKQNSRKKVKNFEKRC